MRAGIKLFFYHLIFIYTSHAYSKASEADLRPEPKKIKFSKAETLFQRSFIDQNNEEIGHFRKQTQALTIYHFYASWCSSCREELVHIPKLLPLIPNSVRLIFVSIDPEQKDALSAFNQKILGKIHVSHDPNGSFLKTLGKKSIPVTFIFNQKNQLVADVSGPILSPPDTFRTYLDKLGAEPLWKHPKRTEIK